MSIIVEFLKELRTASAETAPILEGHHDYQHLVADHTKEIIDQGTADYQDRMDKLTAAIAAVQALADDGYPELPSYVIPPGNLDVLQDNSATILAALGRYSGEEEVVKGTIQFRDVK